MHRGRIHIVWLSLPAILTAWTASALAAANATLRSIEYVSQPGRSQVTLHLSGPVRFTSGSLTKPNRIYIDLTHASSSVSAAPIVSGRDELVERIRFGSLRKDQLRIVLDLKEPVDASLVQLADPPRLVWVLRAIASPQPSRPDTKPIPSAAERVTMPDEVSPLKPAPADLPLAATLKQPQSPVESVPAVGRSLIPPVKPVASTPASPAVIPPPAESARQLTIPRVSSPPKIEEYLKGVPAHPGAVADGFRQREPGDGVPVSRPTTAYLSYDDRNLYVVFVCKEDPGRVRAHLAKREDIGNDDQVGIFLDTFRDSRHAYRFAVNPLGIQSDALTTEGQGDPDYTFDTLWYAEGRLTDFGYVTLMSIPFKSVRFNNEDAQTWGIALRRTIPANNENSYWPYITNRKSGMLQQMARMDGLSAISPGRNVQLIPYGTFTSARLPGSDPSRLVTQNDARVGMDGKAVLGNALTLDVTLNPDFSQVESDDPQVTVNQRYEVIFPEKRPFFLENAGYFRTPVNLFFSRRIADPEFGAKLTGKLGRWDLGMLASDDRAPGERVAGTDSLYGARAVDGVFSLRRELGNQSTIGLFAATQDFGSNSNRVFALDTRLRLATNWFLTGQAVHSFDRRAGGRKTQGSAYYADLLHGGRHLTYEGSFSDFTPDFRARLGYIKRTDIRRTEHFVSYLWYPENSPLLSFGPFAGGGVDWDHHGVLQDWYGNAGFSLDFKGPWGIKISRFQTFERYLDLGFHYDKNDVTFYGGWLRWLYFYGSIDRGAGINYNPAGIDNPSVGKTLDASAGLTLRPRPRWKLDEIYYYDRFQSFAGPVVYTNHLWRTKLNYQFTKALSLRGIVDYYGVLPNTSLIQQERYKQLTGDILLTYLLNPGTALYIGYNNQHENLSNDPDAPGALRRYGPPNYLTHTQIFIKLSYLLRF